MDRTSITEDAWNFINLNRQWDSQDITLRNVEYYLYGLNVATESTLAGIAVALGAPLYDLVKLVVGHAHQENPNSPNSPAGGAIWGIKGVFDGLRLNLQGEQQVFDNFLQGLTAPTPSSDAPGLLWRCPDRC